MNDRQRTVEELCRKLKPVMGEKIDKIYLKYQLTEKREKKDEIYQALAVLFEKHLGVTLLGEKILLEPPLDKTVSGEYGIGAVTYADKEIAQFGLSEKDWVRHVCISGMSGSGKTNAAFVVLKSFIAAKKPFIVFDWKKSFRPLLHLDKSILNFTVGNNKVSNLFKININRPPVGIDAKEWINTLIDLICESFFASFGVHKILRNTLDKAFRDFGVYNGSNNYPTWRHIKNRLERAEEDLGRKRREGEWMESALRIADSLTFGNFGEAICSDDKYAMSVDELMSSKIIFELQSLNNSEKKFFAEYILSWIYFYKKANNETSKKLEAVIVVDEAHNVFLKDKPSFIKESITDLVYREMREFGVGLVCLDQHISKLSDTVAGNSATIIAFQQILPDDVNTISHIFQMQYDKKWFTMLPVGSAIVKLAERYYLPFMINVPLVKESQEKVTDKEIKELMSKKIKFSKRMKVHTEGMDEEKLVAKLQKVDALFQYTGVETNGDLKDVAVRPEDVDASLIKKKSKPQKIKEHYNTINHLQEEIVQELKELLGAGFPESKIRQYFLKRGYKAADIARAMKNVKAKIERDMIRPGELNVKQLKAFIRKNNMIGVCLKKLVKKPMSTSELYKCMSFSARKGNDMKKTMIAFHLIREVEERSERGRKKMIHVTELCKQCL